MCSEVLERVAQRTTTVAMVVMVTMVTNVTMVTQKPRVRGYAVVKTDLMVKINAAALTRV